MKGLKNRHSPPPPPRHSYPYLKTPRATGTVCTLTTEKSAFDRTEIQTEKKMCFWLQGSPAAYKSGMHRDRDFKHFDLARSKGNAFDFQKPA